MNQKPILKTNHLGRDHGLLAGASCASRLAAVLRPPESSVSSGRQCPGIRWDGAPGEELVYRLYSRCRSGAGRGGLPRGVNSGLPRVWITSLISTAYVVENPRKALQTRGNRFFSGSNDHLPRPAGRSPPTMPINQSLTMTKSGTWGQITHDLGKDGLN